MLNLMSSRTIKWDREKLYGQIWTRPLRTVAQEYGLSDVGLAKVCKKLLIPRPGPGYWRRKECGFKVNRVPLPPAKGILAAISHLPDRQTKKPKPLSEELIPLKKAPADSGPIHPVIKQTERAFANGRLGQFGRIEADWQLPHLDLRVTKAGMERALKFMDLLVKLLEANDMTVTPGSGREPAVIRVDGEQIRVVLKEDVRGRRRELTRDEKRNQEKWPSSSQKDFVWTYDATNRLSFEIESYTDSQRRWADTKHRKIEEDVEQIARSILATAAFEKRRLVEREAERRQSERLQQLRYAEQQRIARLRKNAVAWEDAQRIRAYLTAVEDKAASREGGLKGDKVTSRFLKWAHSYADSLDPTGASASTEWEDDEW
jgi:hypothetical protein